MTPAKLIKKDRYPGIRSFEVDDERLFYGRTKEIDDLFSQVVIKPLVVLFSKSGLGKSSLLKAGLGPILVKNAFFPIMIRVQDTGVSPVDMVLSELKPFIDEKKLKQFGGKSTNRIWEAVNACVFRDQDDNLVIPVLIFDQFEELFNHKKAIQNQWASQLADLIEGRLPKEAVEALQQIPRRERTSEQLNWFQPPAVKIVFAIRSDRMSELHQLRNEMPGILQNRYELKPLHAAQSGEAIEKPAALTGNEFTTKPFTFAVETVKDIQSNLSNEAGEIESFQLQIVCQHIEQAVKELQAKGGEKIKATPDFIGGKEGILGILKNYYDNHITNLGKEEDQLAARKLLEEGLIADGRRIGVADAVVKGTFGIGNELLGKLLESRLIRPENTRLGRTFEISHDTLVAPIVKAYDKRRRAEERMAKQKELEEREEELAKEQKKRIFYYKLAAFALGLSVLAIGASVVAWNTLKKSEKLSHYLRFNEDNVAWAYSDGKLGLIDQNGDSLTTFKYDEASEFRKGIAIVSHEAKKALLDVKGTIQSKNFDSISYIHPNRYYADNEIGLVQTVGEGPSPLYTYDYLSKSKSVLIPARRNYLWGYLDSLNTFIEKPDYFYVGDFNSGLARIQTKDGWNYLNKNLDLVSEIYYQASSDFDSGSNTALVLIDNKVKIIDSLLELSAIAPNYPTNLPVMGNFDSSVKFDTLYHNKIHESTVVFGANIFIGNNKSYPIKEIEGSHIFEMQKQLNLFGYLPEIKRSGTFDYHTRSAVRLFQNQLRNLKIGEFGAFVPDGKVGTPTLLAMTKPTFPISNVLLQPTTATIDEHKLWINALKAIKSSYLENRSPVFEQVRKYPRDSDSQAIEDWDFNPNLVHLIGIRRNQDVSTDDNRSNDDLFVLLVNGMVFKFWGSTDPNPRMSGRRDKAFLAEGQHVYSLGWHQRSRENRMYRSLNPSGNGVLLFRDRNNDNALTEADFEVGLDSNPSPTINVHWSGIGRLNWSAGTQVIAGKSYINARDEMVDCSPFAASSYRGLEVGQTKGAYNVLMDLITIYLNEDSNIYYTLLNEDHLRSQPGLADSIDRILERFEIKN